MEDVSRFRSHFWISPERVRFRSHFKINEQKVKRFRARVRLKINNPTYSRVKTRFRAKCNIIAKEKARFRAKIRIKTGKTRLELFARVKLRTTETENDLPDFTILIGDKQYDT